MILDIADWNDNASRCKSNWWLYGNYVNMIVP